jgi:hypothetical protein
VPPHFTAAAAFISDPLTRGQANGSAVVTSRLCRHVENTALAVKHGASRHRHLRNSAHLRGCLLAERRSAQLVQEQKRRNRYA